jgi:hypothetical protein
MLRCVKSLCRSAAKLSLDTASRVGARLETKVFSTPDRRASLTKNKAFAR